MSSGGSLAISLKWRFPFQTAYFTVLLRDKASGQVMHWRREMKAEWCGPSTEDWPAQSFADGECGSGTEIELWRTTVGFSCRANPNPNDELLRVQDEFLAGQHAEYCKSLSKEKHK